jgi:hypothetical protein
MTKQVDFDGVGDGDHKVETRHHVDSRMLPLVLCYLMGETWLIKILFCTR